MDLRFTALFLGPLLLLLVVEVVGVTRKEAGDTLTEHWRYADQWLRRESPWGRWFFRILTAGLLSWTLLHFLGGVD